MGRRPIIKHCSLSDEDKLADLLDYTDVVGDCRIWKGAVNTDGYAHMAGNVKVHRLVYRLSTGESPEGWVVKHSCDTPLCLNPAHLSLGTPGENAHEKFLRDRQPRVVTKEIVFGVRELLAKGLRQKEIAKVFGIDPRRVSDINCNVYTAEGKCSRAKGDIPCAA